MQKVMTATATYKHIGPRPGSYYKQFFVNGTGTRAETVYRATVGPEPRPPEQVARDRGLPLEVVLECIDYSLKNADLLRREREEEADLATRKSLKPVSANGKPA